MDQRFFQLCLFAIIAFSCNAQSINVDGDIMHWEGGFNIGLNNDGFEMDFRGLYFPVQYVGLKVGIGVAGEIEELGDWGRDEWETGHSYAARFKFNPALVLRSSRLIYWEKQDGGFYIFAEPGLVLSPGSIGSKDAKYFRWDLKTGINFQVDRYMLTLGYGISNFSLYSGAPINHWGMPSKKDYITHTVYIGGAVKF